MDQSEEREEEPIVIEFVDPIEQIKRRREALKAKREQFR